MRVFPQHKRGARINYRTIPQKKIYSLLRVAAAALYHYFPFCNNNKYSCARVILEKLSTTTALWRLRACGPRSCTRTLHRNIRKIAAAGAPNLSFHSTFRTISISSNSISQKLNLLFLLFFRRKKIIFFFLQHLNKIKKKSFDIYFICKRRRRTVSGARRSEVCQITERPQWY